VLLALSRSVISRRVGEDAGPGPGNESMSAVIWLGVRAIETSLLPGAVPFDADMAVYPVFCWPTATCVREAVTVPRSSTGEGVWRTGESTVASANSGRLAVERVCRRPTGPNGRSGTAGTAASRLPWVLRRA